MVEFLYSFYLLINIVRLNFALLQFEKGKLIKTTYRKIQTGSKRGLRNLKEFLRIFPEK